MPRSARSSARHFDRECSTWGPSVPTASELSEREAEAAIERRDRTDLARLRARDEVGLGKVDPLELVEL